ncbi:MAG: hypothetical protein WKG00_33905 [Polyangiaceae bacterium]
MLRLALLATLLLATAGLTSAGLVGCGTADCTSVCEDTEFCPNGEDLEACINRCNATEATAASAGCTDPFQTFLSCTGSASNPCSEDACVAEGLAYVECAREYCAGHVGEAGCTPAAGRGCDAIEVTDSATGCLLKATCADGSYTLECQGQACVCAKEGVEQSSVAYQAAFCTDKQLDVRVAAARAACGWPAQ